MWEFIYQHQEDIKFWAFIIVVLALMIVLGSMLNETFDSMGNYEIFKQTPSTV